jgi:hypothetical protein
MEETNCPLLEGATDLLEEKNERLTTSSLIPRQKVM